MLKLGFESELSLNSETWVLYKVRVSFRINFKAWVKVMAKVLVKNRIKVWLYTAHSTHTAQSVHS